MIEIPFLNQKNKNLKKYLGLFLKEQSGILMILSEKGEKITVQKKINFFYSNGCENLTEDVNENLTLITKEKKEEEIDDLIIFVYSHLVNQDTKEIKKPLLISIKRMVEELKFNPLGYIEAGEALVNFLKEKENLPLTAILVELDKTQLSVFIFKGNQIILKKTVSRTDNFIDDLLTVFREKGKEFLPARIIIYNSSDLDQKAEVIITYRWPEEYFIQIPKVTIIKEEELIEALIKVFEDQLKTTKKEKLIEKEERKKEEKMGFMIGKDIGLNEPLVDKKIEDVPQKKSTIFLKKNFLLWFKLPTINFPKISNIKLSKKLTLLFGFFIFLSLFFINEFFFHRLFLTLYPQVKLLEKTITINGIINQSTLSDRLKINMIDSHIELSVSKKTSGEKEIGQKATGEVLIYNNNLAAEETITKGSVLISDGGLKFILEEEIKVASASGDATNPKPSTAKVKVSAYNIGSEYNLPAGTKFRIEGKSANLLAKNEVAFSGGTKNKIKTVSKDDLEDLKKQVTAEAKEKKIQLKKNQKIINDLTAIEFENEKYSKELGEEADDVSLNAKLNLKFYYYDEDQLKNRVIVFLKKDTPKEFEIEKSKIQAKLLKVEKKEENNSITFQFKIDAKMVKKIPEDSLKKEIIFISKNKMADILKDKFQINRYDFQLNSGLLFFERTPLFLKNIKIKLEY